jgi:hypothetical protein
MNLPDMGLQEALEMLQDMAEKAGVLKNDETLSVDLIAFAEAVWVKAYKAGANDEIERASFVYNPDDRQAEFVPPVSLSRAKEQS